MLLKVFCKCSVCLLPYVLSTACDIQKERASSLSSWILNKIFSISAEALIAFTNFFFSTDATAWQALLAPFNRQTTTNSFQQWLLLTNKYFSLQIIEYSVLFLVPDLFHQFYPTICSLWHWQIVCSSLPSCSSSVLSSLLVSLFWTSSSPPPSTFHKFTLSSHSSPGTISGSENQFSFSPRRFTTSPGEEPNFSNYLFCCDHHLWPRVRLISCLLPARLELTILKISC